MSDTRQDPEKLEKARGEQEPTSPSTYAPSKPGVTWWVMGAGDLAVPSASGRASGTVPEQM
jgi:hypothetical protein